LPSRSLLDGIGRVASRGVVRRRSLGTRPESSRIRRLDPPRRRALTGPAQREPRKDQAIRFSIRSLFQIRLAVIAASISLLIAAVQPTTALALDDNVQLLIGGSNEGFTPLTIFTAPGLTTAVVANSPGLGLGESAAQIRMVAGTLGKFRASVVPSGEANSGTVTLMVRVNGVDTELTCSVAVAGGECGSGGKTVTLLNGDRLSVRVVSTLNMGSFAYTYTMTYD